MFLEKPPGRTSVTRLRTTSRLSELHPLLGIPLPLRLRPPSQIWPTYVPFVSTNLSKKSKEPFQSLRYILTVQFFSGPTQVPLYPCHLSICCSPPNSKHKSLQVSLTTAVKSVLQIFPLSPDSPKCLSFPKSFPSDPMRCQPGFLNYSHPSWLA